ncbi:hypothetical protein OKW49_002893 [Paraburkholderia youngii]
MGVFLHAAARGGLAAPAHIVHFVRDHIASMRILAALEDTIPGSVHKKGAGEFTLSGLLKIGVQQVPAKKRRFGKDPFTGEERWFDAKPAAVRLKVRALKKLKDATA